MIYRTFTLTELPLDYQTADIKDTLSFATTGAVSGYEISEDYLSPKNSTVNMIAKSDAVVGQILVLIDDMGVYAMGVITAVDNEKLQIMFRDILELFNDEALNPNRAAQNNDGMQITYLYDGILNTAEILRVLYLGDVDKYRRLPLLVATSGGGITNGEYNEPAVWDYTDNSFNVRNWLTDLFDRNNIIVQARLVFETNKAYIELSIFKNTTSGWLIKNNIPTLKIEQSEDRSPKATICQVVYADDNKEVVPNGTFYLLVDNTVVESKEYDRDTTGKYAQRVQPHRLVVQEFDKERATQDNAEGKPYAKPQTIAESALKYKDFATYISIEIDKNSKMYPKDMRIGDSITIVSKMIEMQKDTEIMSDSDVEKYTIATVFTGRSEKSDNSRVQLTFGKIRVLYTDVMYLESYSKVRR
ncbi:MAG: hypothetical protein FWD76_05475 [Firmicutes bacterium]|nr:hypothetical protein [Bacillota bacterium]